MGMFCYQCEQTAKGTGCSSFGSCGKDPETAALQDLLVYVSKGIAMYATRARSLGAISPGIDRFVCEALFTTVTNVNFDMERMSSVLSEAANVLKQAEKLYIDSCSEKNQTPDVLDGPAIWEFVQDPNELVRQGEKVNIEVNIAKHGPDLSGLQELLLYGVKGTAAYAVHAMRLGSEDPEVYSFFNEALDYLTVDNPSTEKLIEYCLKCGEVNLLVMEMLDKAHTDTYGHPVPTPVRTTPVAGKAILVSGHDLKDLQLLLEQTQGTGVHIYTHGEMLPAHGYPELKKYDHLVGNYGGAWQDQDVEFDAFPGAILMTTNCIQKPKASYHNRIFTSGLVAWPGVKHIADEDFSPVIAAAQDEAGFAVGGDDRSVMVGFGHNAVLGVADRVIEAVKSGAIKHFFLIGGCDGAKPGRNYYTEFAEAVPEDAVILTLACGKFRFNKKDFGDIGGIPRLLDMGQCNDAYSAIKVASALADAFDCSVNELPLSFILSWYEQKAVCILLTLLHLGIQNMRLGPSLPAFVSPDVLSVLVDNFNIMPIGNATEDLAACLG